MTNKDKAFFKKFFELNIKQSYCQLWLTLQADKKLDALTATKVLIIEKRLEELTNEVTNTIATNEQTFLRANLNDIAKQQENWISPERQKVISKEILGYEILLEDLIAEVKAAHPEEVK